MVFASICKHATSAFIFASKSSDQFSDVSSKHFVNFPPAGISFFMQRNLADTFKTAHATGAKLGNMIIMSLSLFNHPQ